MTLLANSYGDVDEIAALVPRYGNSGGFFDSTTRPTLAQVESLTDQVSATLNSILATAGFSIPVTQADAALLLDLWVNQEVAAIAEGINGSGRFGPKAGSKDNLGRWALIRRDAESFVNANAVGIERLGATRANDMLSGMAYRATDESGREIFPLFQREAFGGHHTNWD